MTAPWLPASNECRVPNLARPRALTTNKRNRSWNLGALELGTWILGIFWQSAEHFVFTLNLTKLIKLNTRLHRQTCTNNEGAKRISQRRAQNSNSPKHHTHIHTHTQYTKANTGAALWGWKWVGGPGGRHRRHARTNRQPQ